MNDSDWAKPGVEVIEVSHSSWSTFYGARGRIAKVYANGNFTLEGGKQQYRPYGPGKAATTGGDRYSRTLVYQVTDELVAEMEKDAKVKKARAFLRAERDRLHRISGSNSNEDEAIAAAIALGADLS